MNRLSKFFVLALLSFILANCGGTTAEPDSTAANTNSSAAEIPANSATASNGEQIQPAFNGEMKEVADGFPVPANANVTFVNTNQTKDTMREKPAPDDSTFTAEMNGKGQPVETRTFRSHPILKKVEKITMSPRDYVFKIYLKNGKVVESKSDQLKDFRVISPLNILDAIGMKPPPPPPDPNAPKPEDMKKPVMIPRANP
ncbi:hypothetical protein BH20ACI4_BH20ACI4_11190 [soil metagenome]